MSSTVSIPVGALRATSLAVPELTALGAGVGIVAPEDVPGPWDQDFSHLPEGQRPVIQRPPMGLVLRVHSRAGLDISLLDDAGNQVCPGYGTIGPFDDGSHLMCWPKDPALDKLASVRVVVLDDHT